MRDFYLLHGWDPVETGNEVLVQAINGVLKKQAVTADNISDWRTGLSSAQGGNFAALVLFSIKKGVDRPALAKWLEKALVGKADIKEKNKQTLIEEIDWVENFAGGRAEPVNDACEYATEYIEDACYYGRGRGWGGAENEE